MTDDLSMPRRGFLIYVGVCLALVLSSGLGSWALTRGHSRNAEAQQTRAASIDSQATAKAAQDALKITVETQELHGKIDVISKENQHAILSSAGADARVEAGVHDAGLRALCLRDAYHGEPTCRELLGADPEQSGR